MDILPIQVTKKGVVIPRAYLPGEQFELVVSEKHILVRPKTNGTHSLQPSESSRFSFVGIATSENPNASVEVEEILQQELGQKPDSTSS